MTNTPELDKMSAVREESQAIGEFLEEFLPSKGIELVVYGDAEYVPMRFHYSIEELLAEFFGIDLDKVEQERRAILADLQRSYAQRDREAADAEDACSGSPSSTSSPS